MFVTFIIFHNFDAYFKRLIITNLVAESVGCRCGHEVNGVGVPS